jgi:hypothetical protein
MDELVREFPILAQGRIRSMWGFQVWLGLFDKERRRGEGESLEKL